MVATELAFMLEEAVAGLLIFSGSLIAAERWKNLARSRPAERRFPYFQTHGTSDPILQFEQARALNQLLTETGYHGEFHPFPGGHEVAPHVLSEASGFIVSHLKL
jgi:phospholipase/carboxylesterase